VQSTIFLKANVRLHVVAKNCPQNEQSVMRGSVGRHTGRGVPDKYLDRPGCGLQLRQLAKQPRTLLLDAAYDSNAQTSGAPSHDGEMWFGRTTILVQYWRSMDQLLAYATNREAAHLPAWKSFNQSVANSGDVGVWHETYAVSPGTYENIYVNMPPFGLGKVGTLSPASGALSSARGRVQASGQ
jgi:hypothetical protein